VAQIFKNNTTGTLAAQLNAGSTTCTLYTGHTFTDPGSDWYLATLVGVTGTTETSWEIVKVTNVATNTLTIERAQESTSDATWPAGTRIEARLTAGATESKANLGAAAYKAVGTGSGDVAAGNRGVTNGDSHAHGNITAAGAIGSTANLPIITTTSGALTVGAFGTGATNFCAGNDARLSDARTPTAHNQAETTITFTDVSTGNASTTAHGFAPKATAPASGLRSVLAIDNGETVRSDKALFDATNPAALGTASPGSAMTAARRDHVHALPAGLVTNGDSHNHDGGDGAQIAYSSLSGTPSVREKLTADRTYYVRTDGSDANTGLANTAGGAFLTVQKAVDVVATLDFSIYKATISLADGTHDNGSGIALKRCVGAEPPWIYGSSSAILDAGDITEGSGGATITAANCGSWIFSGFKIVGGHNCLNVAGDAQVYLRGDVELGTCPNAHISAESGSFVGHRHGDGTGHKLSGSCNKHVQATGGSMVYFRWGVTLVGTPAFADSFVVAGANAVMEIGDTSYTGSATGRRYYVSGNATILGNGATALPGNAAGTTETSGVYY